MERRKYPACLILVTQSSNMTETKCNNHVINFIDCREGILWRFIWCVCRGGKMAMFTKTTIMVDDRREEVYELT